MRSGILVGLVGLILVFSASATAVNPGITAQVSQQSPAAPTERVLESGGEYWQGWLLRFDGSRIVDDPATASATERTFQIRGVSEGTVGSLVREFTLSDDGTYIIDTGSLSGQFVIQYRGDTVYVADGVGYIDHPSTAATVDNSTWTIRRQQMGVEWVDQTLYTGQFSKVNMSSNRDGSFTVAVSGDGLSFNNLTTLFSPSDFAPNHSDRSSADELLLRVRPGDGLTVSPVGFAPGTYTLHFEAVDTSAQVTTSFEVNEGDRFVSVESSEDAGDLVNVSIRCSHCYLHVGGRDQGLVDIVELEDGNGDGFVNLSVNTRYAGLYKGASGVPAAVDYYPSPRDHTSRYSPGHRLESIDHVDPHYLNELRSDLSLPPNGRSAPIPAGPLDLTVAESDFSMTRKEYGDHRAPLGGEPVVRDELDVSTVMLRPPTLNRIRSYGVPVQYGAADNLTAFTASLEPRQTVAMGDRIVLRIDVAGIFGYLAHAGVDVNRIIDNDDEGLDVSLRTAGQATPVDLDHSWTRLVADPASDSLYLVIDTGARGARRVLDTGTSYRATMTLSGIKAYQSRYNIYDSPAGFAGYPYLDPGRTDNVETTFEIVPPSAAIEPTADGPIKAPRSRSAVISGTTTLAPRSVVTVDLVGTGDASWSKSTSVTVAPDRSWRAQFDLSNTKLDDGFTVRVIKDSAVLSERRGTIVNPADVTGPTTTQQTVAPGGGGPASNASPSPPLSASPTVTTEGTATADDESAGDPNTAGLLPGFSGLLLPSLAGVLLLIIIGFFVMRLR